MKSNSITILTTIAITFSILSILGNNNITAYAQNSMHKTSISPEQEKLAYDDNGDKKAYTDCDGYKNYTESKGISKKDADYNVTAVDQRITSLYNGGILPEDELDELYCLQAIRSIENPKVENTQENASKTPGQIKMDNIIVSSINNQCQTNFDSMEETIDNVQNLGHIKINPNDSKNSLEENFLLNQYECIKYILAMNGRL